ncbi:MAG TPA: 4Fe-4S dicluster domain-containing protein [Anaerolineales bacterium]|nr:4Fe-4S dicluster domain-containing protein [Anaerolineales bacterium]
MAVDVRYTVHRDDQLCNDCRECLPSCRTGALSWEWSVGEMLVDEWACAGCGDCVTACPEGALSVEARPIG